MGRDLAYVSGGCTVWGYYGFQLVCFRPQLTWTETLSASSLSINTDPRDRDVCKERTTNPSVHALLPPFICRYLLHAS
jgi:hypothetical protein